MEKVICEKMKEWEREEIEWEKEGSVELSENVKTILKQRFFAFLKAKSHY